MWSRTWGRSAHYDGDYLQRIAAIYEAPSIVVVSVVDDRQQPNLLKLIHHSLYMRCFCMISRRCTGILLYINSISKLRSCAVQVSDQHCTTRVWTVSGFSLVRESDIWYCYVGVSQAHPSLVLFLIPFLNLCVSCG